MNNKIKTCAFAASVLAGASMLAMSVSGTGAYFTDSEGGNLTATSGHLNLNTTNTWLNLSDLVPGEDKATTVDFNVDASGKSDVWLVFDPNTTGYAAWTGAKGDSLAPGGGLGRYGHVKISNGGAGMFESWNLQNLPAGGTDDVCAVNADGHGAGRPATSVTDTPPLCGVPTAIKLASSLSTGEGGTLKIEFGLTGRAKAQNATVASVPFKIVATQAGIRPDAANF